MLPSGNQTRPAEKSLKAGKVANQMIDFPALYFYTGVTKPISRNVHGTLLQLPWASCFKLLPVQPATATGLVHAVAFVF